MAKVEILEKLKEYDIKKTDPGIETMLPVGQVASPNKSHYSLADLSIFKREKDNKSAPIEEEIPGAVKGLDQ